METVDCIGLDLGTTNSCVAFHRNGKTDVVAENSRGYIPSVIAVEGYKAICGFAAEIQKGKKNVAYELKRILGKRYSEEITQQCKSRWSFEIKQKDDDSVLVHLQDKERSYDLSVNEMYAMLIRSIKEKSEAYIGDAVTKAVITVPATFSDIYRAITMLCAEAAGLEVVQILEEPVAAAICYANQINSNSKVLVFDMGGGTLDVCILDITADETGKRLYTKLNTDGDPFLGGMDITKAFAEYLKPKLEAHGMAIPQESKFIEICENVKIELSTNDTVDLGFYYNDFAGVEVAREELNRCISGIVNRAIDMVNKCMRDIGLSPVNIDSVIMVGGSSNIPILQEKLRQIFAHVESTVNPEEAIAKGALLYYMGVNGMLNDTRIVVRMETNARYVVQQPDDRVYVIMDKKMNYGAEIRKRFMNARDGDSFIQLPLAQGNSNRFSENQYIGRLIIRDIPIKPKGEVIVTLTCKISMNGIISFSARMDPIGDFPERDAVAELSNPVLPSDKLLVSQTLDWYSRKHQEIDTERQKSRCQQQLTMMKSCLRDRKYEGDKWIYYSLIQNWCDHAEATPQKYETVINDIVHQLEEEGFASYDVSV